MRVGNTADVVKGLIGHFDEKDVKVGAVWMTEEKSTEEIQEQDAVAAICGQHEVDFKLWTDEKYFVDE
jgi:deoxyribodipyrimidine photo-lyase